MKSISIARDFSEYPGLRNCSISENSGEDFYHKILNPAFKDAIENKEKLTVVLDGTSGYASSFLDEAFGNLIYDFSLPVVSKLIEIISEEEPDWIDLLKNKTFKEWEKRRKNMKPPKVTADHNPWFRIVDEKLLSKKWENPLPV